LGAQVSNHIPIFLTSLLIIACTGFKTGWFWIPFKTGTLETSGAIPFTNTISQKNLVIQNQDLKLNGLYLGRFKKLI
jgi:hypothetical protein